MSMMRSVQALAWAAAALAAPVAASAAVVTVDDDYYGGVNTYTGQDVIGPTGVFDISKATFQRIDGGDTLRVTIFTNYAFVPGTAAAEGTGYGALFLTPGAAAWTPTGSAPHYATDVYQTGDWAYAVNMPFNPGQATSGAAKLYAIGSGQVVMSNVNGNQITYPNPGNPGYYFRQGQAVQFTPDANAQGVADASWAVSAGKLSFDINDNGLLGDAFAFSWAMTCGNDVIQGQVTGVPEPQSWALMILGFGGLGAAMRRRRVAGAA